ncbi:hypothetical protein UFOVP529_40 [uncultured Caudovirales phage]|uniref:Uncharacterized protein n=1 Tax=uncultured Caudovirales phage TaxID=2100421 RepID=A0A6J5RE33_9CAUD|nr:hypothetical protein UFOVP529_40 [uncultured Caudovirales phage]CAB4190725.1 hypothetical protein UFOVP1191_98 [uncultured Caudovirales phage]CAB4194476.1 hypothetical protein UFOVP1252_80 [uncultured Caudovirales phage]
MLYISMDIMTSKPVCNEADCSITDARLYTRGEHTRSLCVDCADRFCEDCGVRYDTEYNTAVGMFGADGSLGKIVCQSCSEQ